jgi:hypothetical protein
MDGRTYKLPTESYDEFFIRCNPLSKSENSMWIQILLDASQDQPFYLVEQSLLNLNQGQLQSRSAEIDELAEKHCLTNGKWMIKVEESKVLRSWSQILKHLDDGTLSNVMSVKISTYRCYLAMNENLFTICVYTQDYRDSTIVWRVRKDLEDIGFNVALKNFDDTLQARVMYYKPDIYTHLRAYDKLSEFGTTYMYHDDPGSNWYRGKILSENLGCISL